MADSLPTQETDRPPWLPDRLPVEDPDNDLYIHQRTERNPKGTRVLAVTVDDETTYWVDARDFMEVQKDRDEWRRVCSLINAWRVTTRIITRDTVLVKLLSRVGLGDGEGEAMASLVASVRKEDSRG